MTKINRLMFNIRLQDKDCSTRRGGDVARGAAGRYKYNSLTNNNLF